jgi:hypothetical protein
MARPITWQDVAAPNTSSAVGASLAAGQQISQALAGLGGVATGVRDTIREDATRNAVAGIMNSADPAAAATAAPQGWQVDPLAVANAANQRGQQLQQARQVDASINASNASVEASRASTATNQAALEDRTAEREASTMASPMIDNILKTGKLPSINLNDDQWKTAAGNRAYKQVLDFWGEFQDDRRQAEALYLQRKAIVDNTAKEDFLGWARDFGASPEGQLLDPAEMDRRLTAEAKRRGVSSVHVAPGSQMFEQGAQANKPTGAELSTRAPNSDSTYGQVSGILSAARTDLEAQKAAEVSKFDRAVRGQELAAGTVFTGPSQGIPAQLATAASMDLDDAQDRINRIRAEYPKITDAQAADIALATQDSWTDRGAAKSGQARSMAEAFAEFNKIGGNEGLAREMSGVSARFDKQLSKIPVLERQLAGAARTGAPVPDAANEIVKNFRDASNRAAAAQAEELARPARERMEREQRREQVQKDLSDQFASGQFNY